MNEHTVIWLRRTNLPWLRAVVCPDMAEIHSHSFAWCETLGYTVDRNGKPIRAFVLSHRRPGDGQGPFVADEYRSIPIAARTAQHNHADPPDFTKAADARTRAIEDRIHAQEVKYWTEWEAAHKPAKRKWRLW